jgi:ribA/ribD-fused uncharacterized protein
MNRRDAISRFRGEYNWLSNFFRVDVILDGLTYQSVEHAFQAAKTHDCAERAKLLAIASPVIAKRAGRKVTLRSDWEQVKLDVMLELLRQKFAPGGVLAKKLLATGEALIEEGTRWGDSFWGKVDGEGANHLGRLLMRVRGELQTSSGKAHP